MKTTVGLTVVVVLLVTGCSTTQRVAVKEEPGICAFLGEACNGSSRAQRGKRACAGSTPRATRPSTTR